MKLCFLADARSPIAQNWIRYFLVAKHEVHIISTYPYDQNILPTESFHVVPVAFSWLARSMIQESMNEGKKNCKHRSFLSNLNGESLRSLAYGLRDWFGPLDLYQHLGKVSQIVKDLVPDLVHAMRIPYEGILASEATKNVNIPLLMSVWGNDFTLHAQKSPLIAYLTRRAMSRADALHPDCHRDLRLARGRGFDDPKPALVLPSNGGIRADIFRPGPPNGMLAARWNIPEGVPVVLNPRGFRGYVRNDTFFRTIPFVLEKKPQAIFLGVAMADNVIAERWVQQQQIQHAVRLLPSATQSEMADLFRLADVVVSPSEHDGTPNTLLEGMACGTFPVVGDIESIREWIEDGENGLLCDPANPASLARAVLHALENEDLRRQAAVRNQALVAMRADYQKVMAQAEQFYQDIVSQAKRYPHNLSK